MKFMTARTKNTATTIAMTVKKRLIQLVRQQIVHDVARYQRKRDVDRTHDKCTAHIQQKELFVRGEIG